jgi:hypothetical protein
MPGVMGPPSKPPAKEIEYDVADSLAGTGIDLRAEEQYLAEFYAGSFGQEARTGAPANAPGNKASFYGAGLANQQAEAVAALNQEAYEAEVAQRVWDEAAHRLAATRANEIMNPFLIIANLHHRVEKIAKEHGLAVNLDLRNAQPAGKLRPPQEFPPPKVTVSTKPGLDGTMVATTGSFIPHDAFLVDQLALMSVATKHRLRELIEDATAVAINRQTTSHGEIPAEWADVAVPLRTGLDSLPDDPEGAADANPRKRTVSPALFLFVLLLTWSCRFLRCICIPGLIAEGREARSKEPHGSCPRRRKGRPRRRGRETPEAPEAAQSRARGGRIPRRLCGTRHTRLGSSPRDRYGS